MGAHRGMCVGDDLVTHDPGVALRDSHDLAAVDPLRFHAWREL
jgi:hypothetical protein